MQLGSMVRVGGAKGNGKPWAKPSLDPLFYSSIESIQKSLSQEEGLNDLTPRSQDPDSDGL